MFNRNLNILNFYLMYTPGGPGFSINIILLFGLLISPWKEEILLGLILNKSLRRLGWIHFCSQQIGRISFLRFASEECLDYYRITFRLSQRVVLFIRARGILDLRTYGLRMTVLWIGCILGGNLIIFNVLRVLFGKQTKGFEK